METGMPEPAVFKRSERRGLFFIMPVNSFVDSTLEQSENVTIACFLVVSSSSCCWPAVGDVAYARVGSKFIHLSSAHAHYTNGQSWHAGYCLDLLWACTVYLMHISNIIPLLWHQHTYTIYNKNISEQQFSYIVCVLTWRAWRRIELPVVIAKMSWIGVLDTPSCICFLGNSEINQPVMW